MPARWKEQFDRVSRWYWRFQSVDSGRLHDTVGYDLGSDFLRGQRVVARDKQHRCAARRHLIGELGKIRVVADHDSKRQCTHAEHRHVAARAIDGLTDRRVQFPIDPADGTSMKDGCGVVKATILAEVREPDDRRRHTARERSQDGLELTGSGRYREAGGILDLIGQAAEDRFRTAKNRNPLRLARPDARPNEVERVHRAGCEEWSLIGRNLHTPMIAQLVSPRAARDLKCLTLRALATEAPVAVLLPIQR